VLLYNVSFLGGVYFMLSFKLVLRCFVWLLAFCGVGLANGAAQAERKVISSIKPLALIAQAITEGSAIKVETLLPPASSPHNYALKISDAKRLQTADLVIWLGAEAEPYINSRNIKNHLPLLNHIQKSYLLEGGEGHGHDGHRHHAVDPHIWLDPVLAQEMAALIAKRLIALSPDEKELIQKNLEVFKDKTIKIDQKLIKMLEPHRESGFLAYHDAYGYFVKRYHLHQLGVVWKQEGGGMSVKHLAELEAKVGSAGGVCLFREPQFLSAPLPDFGGAHRVREGILDPLGIEASSYQELLESLANQLVRCLVDNKSKP
jgi:zinc transport system substrate-binding protein